MIPNSIYHLRYLQRLKKFRDFGEVRYHDLRFQYRFPNLELREKIERELDFRLPSGFGSELEQVLWIMDWVHFHIPHDGYADFKGIPNALSIFRHVVFERKGVNCRNIAIVMKDLLLYAGFPSRYVICMPMEDEFDDCHVGNIVYLPRERKWIFVDASMRAYIMNRSRQVLGIEQIRNALISGEELFVSDNLSWNGEPYDPDSYLAYLTKNMFRFACPLISEWTLQNDQFKPLFVLLYPKQQKIRYEKNQIISDGNYNLYITDDASFYWRAPEYPHQLS
jgi:Transglutaminase-like enzymes, putative cysteine proteases